MWLDQWDIPAEADWDQTIDRALHECDRLWQHRNRRLVTGRKRLAAFRTSGRAIVWDTDTGNRVGSFRVSFFDAITD